MYKIIFLILLIIISNSTNAQEPINAYSKDEKIYIEYDNGQVKEVVSDKGNEIIIFTRKSNFILYQKLLKKSNPPVNDDGSFESSDQLAIYLFDIKSDSSKLLFTTCHDGTGGTKPSYSESTIYPFSTICNPSSFMFSPDESKIFFESPAWQVCPSIHYYNLKENKLVFFKAGLLKKIDTKGVQVQVTGVDYVIVKGERQSRGRYWQDRLFDFNGKLIKNIGEKEH